MKIKYKFVFYNPRTDEIGLVLMLNRMLLIDTGMKTGYRIYTDEWQQIGYI